MPSRSHGSSPLQLNPKTLSRSICHSTWSVVARRRHANSCALILGVRLITNNIVHAARTLTLKRAVQDNSDTACLSSFHSRIPSHTRHNRKGYIIIGSGIVGTGARTSKANQTPNISKWLQHVSCALRACKRRELSRGCGDSRGWRSW